MIKPEQNTERQRIFVFVDGKEIYKGTELKPIKIKM
jgi:hypothetical protein